MLSLVDARIDFDDVDAQINLYPSLKVEVMLSNDSSRTAVLEAEVEMVMGVDINLTEEKVLAKIKKWEIVRADFNRAVN